MRFFGLIVLHSLLLLAPAAMVQAEAGLDPFVYDACMGDCDTRTDPCCREVCGYRACIEGNSKRSTRGGLGVNDPAARRAAMAACSPWIGMIEKCRDANQPATETPPSPETTPFIDLDCCRYWLEERGGKKVVTGWYINPAGKRVDYTSQPVHPVSLQSDGNGMFALSNGVGYHVYFVDEGQEDASKGLVYVVRFGKRVEVQYQLRIAGRFWLDLAPDMSSGKVVYNSPSSPNSFLEVPLK